jgi:hypothetical protein
MTTSPPPKKHNYIVGCGGIGAWLAHVLVRQLKSDEHSLVLIDGDTVETKNLNRQFFSEADVDTTKVAALAAKLRVLEPSMTIEEHPEYLADASELQDGSNLFVCVDNHPARALCLSLSDEFNVNCYLAGNEYFTAEAMFYLPAWRNTALDPRIYYPEILQDQTNDPRFPDSCTGEAQNAAPQLATANFTAANFVMDLFTWWTQQVAEQEFPQETQPMWPVHHLLASGLTKSFSIDQKLADMEARTGRRPAPPPLAMPA